MLALWPRLMAGEREDFMHKCEGPVTADLVITLWDRMDETEKALFADWVRGG